MIKSAKYCDLLNQGRVDDGGTISALERIRVKATVNKEVRFVYYKKIDNGNDRMIPRHLNLGEEELLDLLGDAVSQGVFSNAFLLKLKEII